MNVRRMALPAIVILALLMSYPVVINSCAFHPDRRSLPAADELPSGVEELFIPTDDGERIQCYWLARPASSKVVIYFHGNSGNIGHRIPDLMRLAEMGPNVLGAGYRGFGKSTGRPSESGIYRDGRAALYHVVGRLGFNPREVILLGRSIGTTVAVETANAQSVGAVILVTPLTSGRAVARAHGFGPLAYFAGDAFDNLGRIGRIRCPLLVIHGTEDEVLPFEMGRRLYDEAPATRKHFVAIQGAHHNDIARFDPDRYWGAIRGFIAALER